MTKAEARAILKLNIDEIENLIFQMNQMNTMEALGKVYYCLVAIEKILEEE